jgi:hypothetical protein
MDSQIIVKVKYGDDIRKAAFPSSEINSYSVLISWINEIYNLNDSNTLLLKYKDGDGDLVTLANDDDLRLALHTESNLYVHVFFDGNNVSQLWKEFDTFKRTMDSLKIMIEESNEKPSEQSPSVQNISTIQHEQQSYQPSEREQQSYQQPEVSANHVHTSSASPNNFAGGPPPNSFASGLPHGPPQTNFAGGPPPNNFAGGPPRGPSPTNFANGHPHGPPMNFAGGPPPMGLANPFARPQMPSQQRPGNFNNY